MPRPASRSSSPATPNASGSTSEASTNRKSTSLLQTLKAGVHKAKAVEFTDVGAIAGELNKESLLNLNLSISADNEAETDTGDMEYDFEAGLLRQPSQRLTR